MRRSVLAVLLIIIAVLICEDSASASFIVDWGNSWDSPRDKGYSFIARWLKNNGYYSNTTDAANFARNNYIGKNASDQDGFYFGAGSYDVSIVYENSGYVNISKLGYYDSDGKYQIFSGPDGVLTAPKTIDADEDFGFYLRSNYNGGTYWYTDRFDNTAQGGKRFAKYNPQALIYELKDDEQWLVAWEDLDTTNWTSKTDNDYNDMYVLVTANRSSVPEPASVVLMGIGIAGLLIRRKNSFRP